MDDLVAIKKKLDEMKEKRARVEGQLQEVMTRLGEKGYQTIDDAEADLVQKEEEALTIKTQITSKIAELREKYEW
jgi:hypothetical protein